MYQVPSQLKLDYSLAASPDASWAPANSLLLAFAEQWANPTPGLSQRYSRKASLPSCCSYLSLSAVLGSGRGKQKPMPGRPGFSFPLRKLAQFVGWRGEAHHHCPAFLTGTGKSCAVADTGKQQSQAVVVGRDPCCTNWTITLPPPPRPKPALWIQEASFWIKKNFDMNQINHLSVTFIPVCQDLWRDKLENLTFILAPWPNKMRSIFTGNTYFFM